MQKKIIRILVVAMFLLLLVPQVSSAREIIASTAPTLEALHTEIMATVEAARGHETEVVEAEAAILADPVTKNVIFEKNADAKMYPASTTKLMSFVLALEAVEAGTVTLNDQITISPTVEAIEEGDIGLKAGEVYTLEELLLAMAVISANDASVAVAEYLAGSEAQYVEKMNAKAAELGMANTHYVTCSGLHDDNHYTTARDLLTLSYYAIDVPGLLALTSTPSHTFTLSTGAKALTNTNRLLAWYPGADGLKTGFTTPAGYCLTATAVHDDMRLVAVVLGCNKQYSHYSEAMKLLNYGFDNYALAEAVTAGQVLDRIYLPKGKVEAVDVTAQETIVLPTAKEGAAGYTIECNMKEGVKAPVSQGDVIGTVTITAPGGTIAETPMLAAESVAKESFWQTIGRFFRDLYRQIVG